MDWILFIVMSRDFSEWSGVHTDLNKVSKIEDYSIADYDDLLLTNIIWNILYEDDIHNCRFHLQYV